MVMVTSAGASTAAQALELLRAAATSSQDTENPASAVLPPVRSAPWSRQAADRAIAAIQDLVASSRRPEVSPEQAAIGRVKGWIVSGLVTDAAAGRDSAWLERMAKDGALGDLPPLTLEQERTMSTAELRVYVEARYWQAYYDAQPKTLDDARSNYIAMHEQALPDTIQRFRDEIASGRLEGDMLEAWTSHLGEMERQLDAVRSGRVKIELVDPALGIEMDRPNFVRDAAGLVIGSQGGSKVNWEALHERYGSGTGIAYSFSGYLGSYVITW